MSMFHYYSQKHSLEKKDLLNYQVEKEMATHSSILGVTRSGTRLSN